MSTTNNMFLWRGHHHMTLNATWVAYDIDRKSTESSREEWQLCQTLMKTEQLQRTLGKGCGQFLQCPEMDTVQEQAAPWEHGQQVSANSGSSLDV